MANWETQLLSRIISTGDVGTIQRWGITHSDFITPEGRGLFNHIMGYYSHAASRGSVIGPEAIRQQYPTFQIVHDPSMTTEAICAEVRRNRSRYEMRTFMRQADELIEHDPEQALQLLTNGSDFLRRLGMNKQTDVYAADAMERIMASYHMKKQGIDTSICAWPWEAMQEATGGIEKDDYIVIYGRPKSMKSWVLAALIAWCYSVGKRILIYTKEMTADNVLQRVCAIMARVDYGKFRRGKLSPQEEDALYNIQRMLHQRQVVQPLVCLSGKDTGDGGDTVSWLRSKIEEHKPDVCFIDGMYLMSDSRGSAKQKDNFRVQNISRDLRSTILDTGVPVIATIQANRDAAKNKEAHMDEIAFSDAIGQDATVAMRVINEKDKPTLALLIAGSREFKLDGFRIFGVPAQNFDYFGPLTAGEAIDAQRADTEEDVPAGGKSVKRRKKADDAAQPVQAQQGTPAQDLQQTPAPAPAPEDDWMGDLKGMLVACNVNAVA